MRFGSVCSGIEAASVAWSPLGWQAAWVSEIEKFPCEVLKHHYPDVPNLGDMTTLVRRIIGGDVEAPDVLVGGTPCFTSGHLVLSGRGYIPIEQIKPGDCVVSHRGRLCRVKRVGSKEAQVGVISGVGIRESIVCTPDHPFRAVRWRNQSTKRNNRYAKVEHCAHPEWVPAQDMPGLQWCALTTYSIANTEIPSAKFDAKTAMYVAGMYVGDGWIIDWTGKTKKSVILGLNGAKYEKLRAVIGSTTHSIAKERTGIKVHICDTHFANWLSDNFGRKSYAKTIPAWVLGHEFRSEFLRGFLDADGSKEPRGGVSVSTTSRSLAYGISDLLNVEGFVSSVGFVATPDTCVIEGRTVSQRDYYQVKANPQAVSRKSRVRHGYLLRRVVEYTPLGSETVYNIEVEEDHSYIVNGVVVHNCQAFSVAGLRQSLEDDRGQLSLTFIHTLDSIDLVRRNRGELPAIAVWENVPGVLSTKDNAFGCFLAGLVGEECALVPAGKRWSDAGYVSGPERSAAWRILDAQYFGLAQRRRRVFVVASAREGFNPAKVLFEPEGVRRDTPPSRETGESVTHSVAPSLTSSGRGVERGGDSRGQDPVVACHTTGAGYWQEGFGTLRGRPQDSHENLLCMSTGQAGAEIVRDGEPSLTCNHEAPIVTQYGSLAGSLTARHDSSPCADRGMNVVAFKPGQSAEARSIGAQEEIACTLEAGGGGNNKQAIAFHVNAQPDQMNFSADTTAALTRSQNAGALIGMQVRRLTPTECERLQGFPDQYTNIKPNCPDGPRYKALGNSMAVPVMRWIGARIQKEALK